MATNKITSMKKLPKKRKKSAGKIFKQTKDQMKIYHSQKIMISQLIRLKRKKLKKIKSKFYQTKPNNNSR